MSETLNKPKIYLAKFNKYLFFKSYIIFPEVWAAEICAQMIF